MIGLIDIGLGNLRSVGNALEAVGASYRVCREPGELNACNGFILPGVGSFKDASTRLHRAGWKDGLQDQVVEQHKPYLGICLGMQLLATTGLEHGVSPGLNWIEGTVEPIPLTDDTLTVPHMGWNDVVFTSQESGLNQGLGAQACFYFMHSFRFHVVSSEHVQGRTQYGESITACVQRGHIWGAQFHPEKSQESGLHLLRNFKDQVH